MGSMFGGLRSYLTNIDTQMAPRDGDSLISQRLVSIDILRGLVVVLMALDHIRDFFGPTNFRPEDLEQTTVALFMTRWVTHFCAPVFVLLTGVSAYLYGAKRQSRSQLSRFLLTRGLWLILVELLIVNFSWQAGWYGFLFIQVIWVLGVCMIMLAGLIHLPAWAILVFSVIFLAGHNLLDSLTGEQFGAYAWVWALLHERNWIPLWPKGFGVSVVYPLIPWFAVMTAGYLLGPVFLTVKERRANTSGLLGWSCLALFLVLRLPNFYGDPNPWELQERGGVFSLLSILNTAKYPASLSFLLMTLGPSLILLSFLEKRAAVGTKVLAVFGSVPFFFYIIHVPLINVINHFWNYFSYGIFDHFLYKQNGVPEEYEFNLWLVYGVWLLVLPVLYLLCRYFSGLKQRHRKWWMSYL